MGVSSTTYTTPTAQAVGSASFEHSTLQSLGYPAFQQPMPFPGQQMFQNGGSSGFLNYGAQLSQTRLPYMSMPYSYSAVSGLPREPPGPSYLRSSSPVATYLGSQAPLTGGYQFNPTTGALAPSPLQSLAGIPSSRPTELQASAQFARPTSDMRLLSRLSPAASVSVSSDQTGTLSQQAALYDGGVGGRPRSESAAAATTASAYSPATAAASSFRPSSSSDAHALLMSLACNRPDLLASLQQHSAAAAAAAAGPASASSAPPTSSSTTQSLQRSAVTTLSAVARPRAVPASLPVTPASTPATGAPKTMAASDSVVPAASWPGGNILPTVAQAEQLSQANIA